MELQDIYPEKIPSEIVEKNYIDDIILYALSAFGPLQKAEFNQINKTTFYKYLNKLLAKKYISSRREGKNAIYEITPSGQAVLLKRLEKYRLDFQTLIDLEKKKIASQISKLNQFFESYNIIDEVVKIDFLQLQNELTYDESLTIFSEEQFNKLLLFIVMNHPKFIGDPEKVMAIDKFLDKFNGLSKTDIEMFIQEVVEKNRYGERIYKVEFKEDINLFFRANSKLGILFETIIQSHLRDLNYLKSLMNSKIYSDDLEEIVKLILKELIDNYRIFNPELEESLYYIIEDYILSLQMEQFEEPFIELGKIKDFYSLFSDFPSLSFDFKSLDVDSDDDELRMSVHTTFKKIKEKEPINELYDIALKLSINEKPNEALVEINKLIELEPNNFDWLSFKSQILYDLENYEEALNIFEEALKIALPIDDIHDKIDNNTYQTELLTKLKRFDEALDIIENQIPAIFHEDKELTFQKFLDEEYILYDFFKIEANIYYQQKKYKKALDAINKDLQYCLIHKDKASHYPQYAEAISESYWLKSRLLIKLDKLNEALDEINNAIEINPETAASYYQKAKIYQEMYLIPLAARSIKKAIELDHKNKKYFKFLELLLGVNVGVRDYFFKITYLRELFEIYEDGIDIDQLNKLIKNRLFKKGIKEDERFIPKLIEKQILSFSDDKIVHIKDYKFINSMIVVADIIPPWMLLRTLEGLFKENKWEPLDKDFIINELDSINLVDKESIENSLTEWIKKGMIVEIKPNVIKFVKRDFSKIIEKLEKYANSLIK